MTPRDRTTKTAFGELPMRLAKAAYWQGRRAFQAIRHRRRQWLFARSVRHIHGPSRVSYSDEEVLAICIVRNGSKYIGEFIEHHLGLGVKHIVFLDNGSTDDTVALASAWDRVTVLRSELPMGAYEVIMRKYLARRFSRGQWNLMVDVDERFDYPGSDVMGLAGLLRYLNNRGYTAVVAQMLDRFADGPLGGREPGERIGDQFPFYDISGIEKSDYRWGRLASDEVRMHNGGIRRLIFGTNNGLSKAALVRLVPGVRPFAAWHHADGALVADFTAVLQHYPFNEDFAAKVEDTVLAQRFVSAAHEYVLYRERISAGQPIVLRLPTSRRFAGLSELLDERFLVASREYLDWVKSHRGGR